MYREQSNNRLSDCIKVSESIYVSKCDNLTLSEYVKARKEFCKYVHKYGTCDCISMLQIATTILNEGFLSLKQAYTKHFPSVKYKPDHARRRLLQMPLACVRIVFSAGVSECYIVEHRPQINHESVLSLLKNLVHKDSSKTSLSKPEVKSLLAICQSDRERECVRYAIYKSSGVTATQARKQFGFKSMNQRSKRLEEVLKHALYIREAIDKLARTKEVSVLRALGVDLTESECDTSSDESTDESEDERDPYNLSLNQTDSSLCLKSHLPGITKLIKESHFNFFEIIANLQHDSDVNHIPPMKVCEELTELVELDSLKLGRNETEQLKISCEAYRVDEEINSSFKKRAANVLNGDIVTDSESDTDPDIVSKANTPFDASLKALIKKKRASIKLQASRSKAKQVAKTFLVAEYPEK